jgi:hypothetical protein
MPRVQPGAPKKERSPAQLANDARLREGRKAKDVPAIRRKMVESAEQAVPQLPTRGFDENSELAKIGFQAEGGGKRQKRVRGEKWMADMAFANELVTVRVHESTDKNADPFPLISVNGRPQRFVRGNEQQVRRCYVEKLARLKHTAYDSLKTKDPDGEDVYRYPSRTGLVYDFTVIDDTPKGQAWLKQVLSEPG